MQMTQCERTARRAFPGAYEHGMDSGTNVYPLRNEQRTTSSAGGPDAPRLAWWTTQQENRP
jgi:hypothetical protein